MKLIDDDNYLLKRVNKTDIPLGLFHGLYLCGQPQEDDKLLFGRSAHCEHALFTSSKYKHLHPGLIRQAFFFRMEAFHGLMADPIAADWFHPERYDFTHNRHPYLIAAAVHVLKFRVVNGRNFFAFDPEGFRQLLSDIEVAGRGPWS